MPTHRSSIGAARGICQRRILTAAVIATVITALVPPAAAPAMAASLLHGLNSQPLPPGMRHALNPQPLPPGIRHALNPQPLPPGMRYALNPQPLPPGRSAEHAYIPARPFPNGHGPGIACHQVCTQVISRGKAAAPMCGHWQTVC
jgi:hypothetical protein